jgi:8-amino-7-oxononanoate synthase
MSKSNMNEFIDAYLSECRRLNLYRAPAVYEPIDAAHVRADGKTCLMLASNNYLGLTHHPEVKAAAGAAIEVYGTGAGGSRLTTGSHLLYPLLEADLAAFKGTEAAIVFNSGFMANVGTISVLAGSDDVIFSDELNHASIIDGCRLSRARTVVYRHADLRHLEEQLTATPCGGQRLIVTDGVFSMDGDVAPLDGIVELARRFDAMVMVDDAHAVGVLGKGGAGTAAHFGLQDRIHVQMGTLSKALAAEGGYVAGSRQLIAYLVNKARSYIFSTALAPATVAAARAAVNVLTRQPELTLKLRSNAQVMKQALTEAGLKVEGVGTPIFPILVGEAKIALAMARGLKEAGIIVSAIRPPTVPLGTSRLRVTVSAAHKEAELADAAAKIIAAGRCLGLIR